MLSTGSHLLLGAYYYATLPQRLMRNSQTARSGMAPVMVVFYHRVADRSLNDWTISNHQFEKQVCWMHRHFDMISLAEAQQRIRSGRNLRPAVSLTFDDGYADNCDRALPLLIQKRIPCTYFVASQQVLTGTPFPHDVGAGRPLAVNNMDQLRRLVDQGIDIGAHTRTHADLGSVDDAEQLQQEVVECRNELRRALNCSIRYFAFPYGLATNLSAAAFRMAKEAGYDGACSAYGGYNFPGDDAYHLQRFHGDPQTLRLKNWLTVDPRKHHIARFEYRGRPLVTAPEGASVL